MRCKKIGRGVRICNCLRNEEVHLIPGSGATSEHFWWGWSTSVWRFCAIGVENVYIRFFQGCKYIFIEVILLRIIIIIILTSTTLKFEHIIPWRRFFVDFVDRGIVQRVIVLNWRVGIIWLLWGQSKMRLLGRGRHIGHFWWRF